MPSSDFDDNVAFFFYEKLCTLLIGISIFGVELVWVIGVVLELIILVLILQYSPPTAEDIRVLRAHQLSVTCVVITPDDRFVFSGSKDCSIIKCKHKSRPKLFPS